ncbi:hypothetical protein V8E54_011134 [Elaphomyces granulatus]
MKTSKFLYLLFSLLAFFFSPSQCQIIISHNCSEVGSIIECEIPIDCSPNSTNGLMADCWSLLNMSQYIESWMNANGSSADCDSLGFAQCFLQWNGYTGLTCNLITSDTCPPFDTENTIYSSDQEFYALWNIYTVYQFFNQYSTALGNGVSLAGQTIGAIVTAVAPPVESEAQSSALLSVLAGTLTFFGHFIGLGIPGGSGRLPNVIASGITLALVGFEVLSNTLQQTPTQSANDRAVQLGQIGNSLSQFVIQYQQNILQMVESIQGNSTTFTTLCSSGGFSERVTYTLTDESNILYQQLQGYILSLALQANGFVVSRSTGISALDVAGETSNVNCPSLSSAGNCNQWWFDSDTYTTYALHNPNDPENDHADLTNQIANNNWASLSDLFQVENCTGKDVSFNENSLGADCVFNLTYCKYNYTSMVDYQTTTQFLNCPNDPQWGYQCSSFTQSILLPQSYLGPLLFVDDNYCRQL